jgi:hypothetical protein
MRIEAEIRAAALALARAGMDRQPGDPLGALLRLAVDQLEACARLASSIEAPGGQARS